MNYVVDQLAMLGLTPRDIDFLVCTHFDTDHSGNHGAFPDSEFIVQRAHYEAARCGKYDRFNQTRLVVFGHDENHWPSLKKAPDFYS